MRCTPKLTQSPGRTSVRSLSFCVFWSANVFLSLEVPVGDCGLRSARAFELPSSANIACRLCKSLWDLAQDPGLGVFT